MSRKNLSFYQLLNYFEKEQVQERFTWNLYSSLVDKQEIIKEFMENAEYLKKSRGKVFMYHEVIALEKNDLSLERQTEILKELTKLYVIQRANEHLVYGVIHQDTKNLHMHLMISSNKISENKRVRLSKKEFAHIQKQLEQYKNQKFEKELEQTQLYQKEKEQVKETVKEQEIKHRRKKQTKKEEVREQLEKIFNRSFSKEALEKAFKDQGFELYQRGKTIGIKFENKSYRFKTLGIEQEYKQTLSKFTKREQRQEKRQEFKHEQKQQRKTSTQKKTQTQDKSQGFTRQR